MIIDSTYFINDISLPTDEGNYLNKLNYWITKVEKKILIDCLGYELWSLFNAELPTPTTARYTAILDGAEYTNSNGYLDYWNGLANTDKESFLAYFTYFYYVKNAQKSASGQGTTSNLFENADKADPSELLKTAYNSGYDLYYKLYDYLLVNIDTYPEWHFTEKEKEKVNIFNI